MPFDFSEASDTEPTNLHESVDTGPGGIQFGGSPDTGPQFQPAPVMPAVVQHHDPTKLQVFAAIAPVLSELLAEVRRSFEYYTGRAADGRIDEILLCGGSSGIRNLATFFTQELGIPARVESPFTNVSVASKNYSAEYLEGVASSFAVAVGLASRDLVAVKVPAAAASRKRGKK